MPLAHDQFDNAARVKRLGVGDWIVPSRFRGPMVAARLDALLTSEAVKRACQRMSEKLTPRNGIASAADAIEQFGEQARREWPG
jgi:UDP:flavonoid glycosyltransferase YjiC (YdhE family)